MKEFKKGQLVTCVNTECLGDNKVAPPLEKGKKYEIKNVCLDKENNQHLDVGLQSTVEFVRSYETKEELPYSNSIHWCHPSRFE